MPSPPYRDVGECFRVCVRASVGWFTAVVWVTLAEMARIVAAVSHLSFWQRKLY